MAFREKRSPVRILVAMMLIASMTCLLFPESLSLDPSEATNIGDPPESCPPTNVCNPVNNIQISTYDPNTTQPEATECATNCSSSCDKLLGVVDLLLQRLDDACDNRSQIPAPVHQPSPPPPQLLLPKDCADIQAAGFNASGRYVVYPTDNVQDPFFVFCDLETSGGGWTVFQRRQDGSVDFSLNWRDYRNGFGNVEGEHWLGNEKIYRLTSQKTYTLRVDLADFEGETRYAEYGEFLLKNEDSKYQLSLGEYTGTAGDALVYQGGMMFTTKDNDNDKFSTNCADTFKDGWWFNACHKANLNGLYLGGPISEEWYGIQWDTWKGDYYSLKSSEMKVRPLS